MNYAILTGRLVRDPELRYTADTQTPVCKFTIAVDKHLGAEKKADADAKNRRTADFIRITVWGKQAENCGKYLIKGKLIGVEGSIEADSYKDDDGNWRDNTYVKATMVEFLERMEKRTDDGEDFRPSGIDEDDLPF